jgi:plastocyanin domain-containing protein
MVFAIDSNSIVTGSAPSVIALALVVILLIAKEISIAVPARRVQAVSRIVDVGLIPLGIVSTVVIATAVLL